MYVGIIFNFTFKTSYDIFNFKNSIRAHVRHRAFAILQIELYRVVDYDSKWSTKFYRGSMFDFFCNFTLKTSYDNFFILERQGLLNNTQHGFRSGRSCLSALINVFDNLINMIDSSTTVDMIYLDFSKAFGKVGHGIVLHKLRDLGITGNLGVWFHQFLSDRTQFVRLPGGASKDSPVLSGVPQGTVLGPLLFIIMMSDINKDILSSKIISFADDTRFYTNITLIENSDNLQTDLKYIYSWATNNNMLFNHQKFNYISFSSSMSSINTNVYYSPRLDIINPSENDLDLGITMSRNCSFDVHINILCKKCTDLSGWILRTFASL